MKKIKKIITSVLILLVFLCLFLPKSNANFFTDDWDKKDEKTEIEKTIDSDDGGIFEKIIAQMIGGIAETVFDLTTNEDLNMGFKNYDELIFAQNSTDVSPFTEKQWDSMMVWYKIMSAIAGSLILIVVVVTAFKIIISGYSIEQRNEAKDSLMRLFFGAVATIFAPLFVKFLLFLNNRLVQMLVGYSNGSLDELLGNNVITNISTGNAIATAIVIALFAYLFFKLNVKFIIRQFTILIFTLFTPIVSIMWMLNKRTIGASIWFGQILINVFMQFIYAFLFLIYMQFLPQAGGWAVSILWAMMILPIADVLQNTLQNLISRVAGINNDELANRGMGMAGEMAYSVRAISYQFKNSGGENNNSNLLGRIFSKQDTFTNSEFTPMNTSSMEQVSMQTTKVGGNNNTENDVTKQNNKIHIASAKVGVGSKVLNTGKEFMNMGMYMAEGKNFRDNKYNKNNVINNDKKKINNIENNIVTNIQEQDKL